MSRLRIALALAAPAVGVGVAALMLSNDVRHASAADVVVVLAIGWSFIAAGVIAWQRRPRNPIGPAMIATGYLRFAAALWWSQDPVVFAIGHLLEPAYIVGFAYVLIAFPLGRLQASLDRWLLGAAFAIAVPLHALWLLLGGQHPAGQCKGCPADVVAVAHDSGLSLAVYTLHDALAALVAATLAGVVIRRWRRASEAERFAIAPVLWVGTVALVACAVWVTNGAVGMPLGEAPETVFGLTLAALAGAFLAGLLRTRLARSAVADLIVELGQTAPPGKLRDALAAALHDPSLKLAYWLSAEQRYVDAAGRPIAPPDAQEGCAMTLVERDGRRIAALIHDPALCDEPELVDSACAAAALALDNERLQAELRARLEELRASRARIVEATEDERRRIERDLHDGTQQRLVSIAMTLGLAESRLKGDPAAHALLREAHGGISDALEELRELSHGIHPGALGERGLEPALEELALRAHVPVELDVSVDARLPERVETAAYYVVSEALANVAKHAEASAVRVSVSRLNGRLLVEVADDGKGGADLTAGSGLRGLADRVDATGGHLSVASPPGDGTTVNAEIPCG